MSDDSRLILKEIRQVKSDLTELKSDVTELKSDVTELKSDVTELKSDVTELKNDVTKLKKDVKDVQLSLENETNRNIQFIAEGHLDLARKLDDALKVESEKEMLLIRVTSLENEVRRLKAGI